jgi:hypothetical protein
MLMGSTLSDGHYLYINRSHSSWKDAFLFLLQQAREEQERQGANMLFLRDFDAGDNELQDFLNGQGFIKTELPDTHLIENMNWKTQEEFLNQLNHPKRQYFRNKVVKYEPSYEVEIANFTSDTGQWHTLYKNVQQKSFEVNGFDLPSLFFDNIARHPNWEVIQLFLKPGNEPTSKKLVAVMCCFKTPERYFPVLVGMDYTYVETHNVYPQILWQTIKRAKQLNIQAIALGLTASQNKRKFGAKAIPQCAYIQMKDNYNLALIGLMANKE